MFSRVYVLVDKEALRKKIISVLETVVDPEIGIDVYNLGMIYGIEVIDEKHVKITMTFTTAFCPLANVIPMIIRDQLKKQLDIDAEIELTFDPPWTPEKMTEKGRKIFIERYGYDIVEEWRKRYAQ